MILIADASAIIAASDRKAPEAADCQRALREAGTVIVSPLVLGEVDHLTRRRLGSAARTHVLSAILHEARKLRFQIPEVTLDVLTTAQGVQQGFRDLDLDLADAVNVALAADYRTNAILTLNRRDFRALRPLTPHKAFRVLPDDL